MQDLTKHPDSKSSQRYRERAERKEAIRRVQESHLALRWILWRVLRFIEWCLLLAYGWKRVPGSELLVSHEVWGLPLGHPKTGSAPYDHDHAVNSLKFYEEKRSPADQAGVRVDRSRTRARRFES